jgi:hypothetical protein
MIRPQTSIQIHSPENTSSEAEVPNYKNAQLGAVRALGVFLAGSKSVLYSRLPAFIIRLSNEEQDSAGKQEDS